MTRAFLGLDAADILARVETIAAAAAGGPVGVRVGADVYGYCNVGVDLPRGRRSAAEGRLLRRRVSAALEATGMVMTATAGAPRVEGDILGHVHVRELAVNWGDAAGLAQAPRRG